MGLYFRVVEVEIECPPVLFCFVLYGQSPSKRRVLRVPRRRRSVVETFAAAFPCLSSKDGDSIDDSNSAR